MFKRIFITGFGLTLLSSTGVTAQQTQTGAPAEPTSSIYNRMRRFPAQPQGDNSQSQTTQTQQFPNPAQQFPPEQQGVPGHRPAMNFPHASGPEQQQPAQAPVEHGGVPANTQASAPQSPQAAYGLALQPANPPRIGYANGQLTVSADNSSLSEILNNVGRMTGARIEGNPADAERVFGQFGPGRPRDVLNSLLSGSRYDFILVGAIDDPGSVEQVLLTPHGGSLSGGGTTSTQLGNRPNPTQAEEEESNNEVIAPQPIVEPPQPPTQAGAPGEPAPPGQQQVKTPEQLLQELQRLRQQQQQNTQQNPH